VIVGERIIVYPRICDLHTGKIITKREHDSGQDVPLKVGISEAIGGCGIASASPHTLFYRHSSIAICDLAGDSQARMFGGIRPGCWLNIICANGLVLVPESSSGCTCPYPLRCSFALINRAACN